ncbi:MAG: response regulator, partial [SAR324 cluster bacterium]|nr:response regulator [SAR324 cluster bacterium]
PFDIVSELESTCEILSFRSAQKSLELINKIDLKTPKILMGDASRIRQILVNLAGNAIKFTETGEVMIETHLVEDSASRVHIQFAVKDTGIGIPEDKLEAVFESFAQVDASITRKFGGTGLGLTISNQLVNLMGGKIWVESKLGEGSQFYFSIPFKKVPPEQQELICHSQLVEGKKILIIDDNQHSLEVLQDLFKNCGAEVMTCNRFEVARAVLAREGDVDLILLDESVSDSQESLQPPEGQENPPVILMTLQRDLSLIRNPSQYKFAGMLAKPISQAELENLMMELFSTAPAKLAATSKGPKRELSADLKLPQARILMAEDNQDNTDLIEIFMKKTPFTLVTAENGQEAVDHFKKFQWDLVLMDMEMPVKSGLEAVREIRAWEQEQGRKPTPIIALTAHALEEHKTLSFEAGCNGHLSKPIKKKLLLKSVADYLVAE